MPEPSNKKRKFSPSSSSQVTFSNSEHSRNLERDLRASHRKNIRSESENVDLRQKVKDYTTAIYELDQQQLIHLQTAEETLRTEIEHNYDQFFDILKQYHQDIVNKLQETQQSYKQAGVLFLQKQELKNKISTLENSLKNSQQQSLRNFYNKQRADAHEISLLHLQRTAIINMLMQEPWIDSVLRVGERGLLRIKEKLIHLDWRKTSQDKEILFKLIKEEDQALSILSETPEHIQKRRKVAMQLGLAATIVVVSSAAALYMSLASGAVSVQSNVYSAVCTSANLLERLECGIKIIDRMAKPDILPL